MFCGNCGLSGASRQEVQEAETSLDCHLPPAASLLYQQCNGQEIPEDEFEYDESTSDTHHVGLIGGYYFANHYVNVHLLSLREVQYSLPAGSSWSSLTS